MQLLCACVLAAAAALGQAQGTTDTMSDQGSYMLTVPKELRIGQKALLGVSSSSALSQALTFGISLVEYTVSWYTGEDKRGNITYAPFEFSVNPGEVLTVKWDIPSNVNPSSDHRRQTVVLVTVTGGANGRMEQQIGLTSKTMSIFVQTDKAMYKPSDKVMFRVFATNANLKPYLDAFNVTILDSQGTILKKFKDRKADSGILSLEFELSDQPPLGLWVIKVKAKRNTLEKNFEVAEYVLPKFEVTLTIPPYLLEQSEHLSASVEAKYTFGQPVKGNMNFWIYIDYSCQMPNVDRSKLNTWQRRMPTCPMVQRMMELEDGKVKLELTKREVVDLLPDSVCPRLFHARSANGEAEEENPPYVYNLASCNKMTHLKYKTIQVVANVTETLTGKTIGDKGKVSVKGNTFMMTFSQVTPNNYKPGMPYMAFLEVQNPDSTPVEPQALKKPNGDPLTIKVSYTMNCPYTREPLRPLGAGAPDSEPPKVPSCTGGHYDEIIEADPSGVTLLVREEGFDDIYDSITIRVEMKTGYKDETISTSKSIQKFSSKNDVALTVRAELGESGSLTPPDVLSFFIKFTVPMSRMYYQLYGKGSLVHYEVVEFARETKEYELTVQFTEELGQKVAPTAKLVVWIIKEGEIIADSISFTVNGVMSNEVSLSFSKNVTEPGEDVAVHYSAAQGSTVAILATDMSVRLLKGGNDITAEMVEQEAASYDSSYHPWMWAWRGRGPVMMDKRRRKRSSYCYWCFPFFISGTNTKELLKNAGILVFTDYLLYEPPQPEYTYTKGIKDVSPLGRAGPMVLAAAPMPAAFTPDNDSSKTSSDLAPAPAKPRTEFPETFIWTEKSLGDSGQGTFRVKVPDTITSWVASAFALSPSAGLGVSDQATMKTFKPFFASLNLPYSVIRGEEFALKVNVFNYLNDEEEVLVTLKASKDYLVRYRNQQATKTVFQQVSIPAQDAKEVIFMVKPEVIGQIELYVKAQSRMASDSLIRQLLVEPEGKPNTFTSNELMTLTASNPLVIKSVDVKFPDTNVVEGSQRIQLNLVGDLMGSAMGNLGSLIRLPYGCGEQNMVNFAPAVSIMQYLTASGQVTPEIEQKAVRSMTQGYQREMTYKWKNGAFSAFGERDKAGSTWLTAFVADTFRQAAQFIDIDQNEVKSALNFVLQQQNKDGAFNESGRVLHKGLHGGSGEGMGLTAYIVTTLMKAKDYLLECEEGVCDSDNDHEVLMNKLNKAVTDGLDYLTSMIPELTDKPYELTMVGFTLAMSGAENRMADYEQVKEKLDALAITKDDMMYWSLTPDKEPPRYDSARPWLYYQHTPTQNIEMAAYNMKRLLLKNDVSSSISVLQYLTSKQNANGGFRSTQETVQALSAMAQLATKIHPTSGNKRVTVHANLGRRSHSFDTVTNENAMITQQLVVPKDVSNIELRAEGEGMVLVQVVFDWYEMDLEAKPELELSVVSEQKGVTVESQFCFQWSTAQPDDENEGMCMVEVSALSGYDFDQNEILNRYGTLGLMRVERTGKRLLLYWDRCTNEPTCFNVTQWRQIAIVNMQPARVLAYSYYQPEKQSTQFYPLQTAALTAVSPCEVCPKCCDEDAEKLDEDSIYKLVKARPQEAGVKDGPGGGGDMVRSMHMVLIIALGLAVWGLK